MQQERERGRREEDQQDRRMNKQAADQQNQNNQQQQQQQQQPQQKCPRCDSYNTKFCYYNNYSLSQPRYFCKTCKRYWTQGGTLRNVPVGGGCRKGKRTKTSSSSGETSRSSQAPPLLPSPSAVQQQQPSPVGQINPYYQGGGGAGGFLSSLAAIQSLNQPINNHQLGGGNYIRGPSNMALLQGFTIPNLGSHQPQPHHHQQQQQQQQSQFFQMGINGDKNMEIHQPSPLYQSSQQQSLIQPSSTLNQNWQQHGSFINNTPNNIPSNPTPSDSGLWNIGGATATTTTTAGSSLSPNQWHDHQLAGYGPPPQ